MPATRVFPPPELRAAVRRVRRRPGTAWWDVLAIRLFCLPFLLAGLAGVAAALGMTAWAAFGTDHDARVRNASRGATRHGNPYYRATYTYEIDGRLRYGESRVSANTHDAFRFTPETKPTVRIRVFGRPPFVYDAPMDTAWSDVALAWFVGSLGCGVALIFYYQAYVEPFRIRKLYRRGAVAQVSTPAAPEYAAKDFKTLVHLRYQYTTPDGRTRTGSAHLTEPEWRALAYSDEINWVLYDPAHPNRSVLYGLGPYRCAPPSAACVDVP